MIEIDKFFNKHVKNGKPVKGGRLSNNLGAIIFSIGAYVGVTIILQTTTSSEMSTILAKYQATNAGQTVTGRNLLILKKVNGVWVILIHMTVV